MASVRVYVKKKIEVGRMNFGQRAMFKVGTTGLAAIKDRVKRAINPNDAPAKPLNPQYARRKLKLRGTIQKLNQGGTGPEHNVINTLTNKRDLHFTGAMMRNLTVRSVSEYQVRMDWTIKLQREKARMNNRRDPFVDFSPRNVDTVTKVVQHQVAELVPKLIKTKL